ncbi:MAG TPA: DUF2059 domain-containing protein [Thermoanaerobaculia bacterium]|nr:DUF2059 domain-containing protein [Thermoanaerobaculia bacterium]
MMKKLAARLVLGALLTLGLAAAAGADQGRPAPPRAKEAKIRQLLAATGAGQLGVQVMNQMLPSLKKLVPEAPDSFWTDFFKEARPEALVELVVPIYDKYFNEADLDALIAFYTSPVGRKAIQVLPSVMAESMQAGQQWGQEIAKRVVERARKDGLKVNT